MKFTFSGPLSLIGYCAASVTATQQASTNQNLKRGVDFFIC